MNRTELVANVVGNTKLPKVLVTDVLVDVLDQITQALEAGERVQLTGFGTFEARAMGARRSLWNDKFHEVPERKRVFFRSHKSLRDSVNRPQ